MPAFTDHVVQPGTMARLPQPTFSLTDIVLRPWRPDDAPAVEAAYADPRIQQWHARWMTAEEARAWVGSWPGRWNQEADAGWAITDESGVLGQISLRQLKLSEGLAWVSYWVVPAARGRRLASRALSAVTAWAFDDLGLHRVELNHATANLASCRVATSAGFALEGTKRSQALHADGWHDMHSHVRIAGDPVPA